MIAMLGSHQATEAPVMRKIKNNVGMESVLLLTQEKKINL